MTTTAKLWQPSPERIARARLTGSPARLAAAHGAAFPDYGAQWRWTVDNEADFWKAVGDCAGIVEPAVRDVLHGRAVNNAEALANPEALEQYRDREELKR